VHRIVDDLVKFYAPTIDDAGCFRSAQPFRSSCNQLRSTYVDIVQKHQTCVVTSHDTTLRLLAASDCQEILTKHQIKVLITAKNKAKAAWLATIKNLETAVRTTVHAMADAAAFDHVVDIDEIQSDWSTCRNFCDQIGLRLDAKQFDQYQALLAGDRSQMQQNYHIEIWRSRTDGTEIAYDLESIHQPTLQHKEPT
jgi:hypothetical protein